MFLSPLAVEKVAEADGIVPAIWCLLDPLVFSSHRVGMVIVPAGFCTDFASVPLWPLAFLLTGDTAHGSAVLHDYLVEQGEDWCQAADVFKEAMQAEDVPAWRRHLMYWAVRLAGPIERPSTHPSDQEQQQ